MSITTSDDQFILAKDDLHGKILSLTQAQDDGDHPDMILGIETSEGTVQVRMSWEEARHLMIWLQECYPGRRA